MLGGGLGRLAEWPSDPCRVSPRRPVSSSGSCSSAGLIDSSSDSFSVGELSFVVGAPPAVGPWYRARAPARRSSRRCPPRERPACPRPAPRPPPRRLRRPPDGLSIGTALTLMNPASASSSRASSRSRPTRSSGILVVAGPTLISAVTVLPCSTSTSGFGDCLTTVPRVSSSGPRRWMNAACSPASRRLASASARVFPWSDGTLTRRSPPGPSSQYAPKSRPPSTSRVRAAMTTVRPAECRGSGGGTKESAVVPVAPRPMRRRRSVPPALPRRQRERGFLLHLGYRLGTGTTGTSWVSTSRSPGSAASAGRPSRMRSMSAAISAAD